MHISLINQNRAGFQLFYKLLIFCFCLTFFTSCSSTKTIVNNLDEKEANEIIVFLAGKGIDSAKVQSKEAGGGGASKIVLWDIQVDAENSTEAMSLLNQAGLPRRRGQNLLGIFAGGGLVPSELQEKIRYNAGLAEQIASTIRKIDGILDAEVQISFPEEDPLTGKAKGKITASVYVKHSGVLDDPNVLLAQKIKRLVSASITGLDYDNVTVIGDKARYNPPSGSLGSLAQEEKLYVSIWSIILAKESATRFRIFFFSFILAILLLTLLTVWLIWKLYPILRTNGGIKQLFSLHPIAINGQEEKPKEAESKESAEKAAKAKGEEESQVDQEIEE